MINLLIYLVTSLMMLAADAAFLTIPIHLSMYSHARWMWPVVIHVHLVMLLTCVMSGLLTTSFIVKIELQTNIQKHIVSTDRK